MSITTRLERMEKDLKEPAETVIRFADPNGAYSETEEDKRKSRRVIKVIAGGIKGIQLKRWAQ